MPNWQKHKPVSGMSVEEMKRRVADGIKRRRQTGEMRPATLRNLETKPEGPHLTKKHKRALFRAADLAIYSLANNQKLDYCHAVDLFMAVRREAGLSKQFLVDLCKGIAEQAALLSGEPFPVLDQLARAWLAEHFNPSDKLISIPKGPT